MHQPFHDRLPAAALCIAVVLTGCNASGTTAGADAQAGTDEAAAIAASIDEVMPQLEEVFAFDGEGPMDYDEGIRFNERGEAAATAMLDALPATFDGGTAEDAAAFDAMRAALVSWQEDSADSIELLTQDRSLLEPELEVWLEATTTEGDPGPPPAGYMDLLVVNDDGAFAFGDACADFVVRFDLDTQCYALGGGEGEGEEMGDAGPLEVSIGDVDLLFDPGPSEDVAMAPGGAGVDVGGFTLSVGAPPDVRDPSTDLDDVRDPSTLDLDDESAPLLAWPDDLPAWAAQLPFEVIEQGQADIGEWTWSFLALRNTADLAEWFVLRESVSDVFAFPGSGIVLFETTIDGQAVVAVATGAPGFPAEDIREEAAERLSGLRRP